MKKLSKKLKLNKETVSTLTNEQMNDVKGGAISLFHECHPVSYSIGIPDCIAPPCGRTTTNG